jgi:hypothetical protein
MQPSEVNTSSEGYKVERLRRQLKRRDEEIETLRRKVFDLTKQLDSLKVKNEELTQGLASDHTPEDGYRKDWTWVRKIVFVLEAAGKPLRSPEIIEELAKREEHLRNHWNQAQYFSAFLNKAVKEERIKQEKRKGERGYYYSV